LQHFNNEAYEAAQYDKHLKDYEKSSIKITTSLAFLNSGQTVIFSSALTMAMFLAAQGVVNGAPFPESEEQTWTFPQVR
jgi:ABC transporter ATM